MSWLWLKSWCSVGIGKAEGQRLGKRTQRPGRSCGLLSYGSLWVPSFESVSLGACHHGCLNQKGIGSGRVLVPTPHSGPCLRLHGQNSLATFESPVCWERGWPVPTALSGPSCSLGPLNSPGPSYRTRWSPEQLWLRPGQGQALLTAHPWQSQAPATLLSDRPVSRSCRTSGYKVPLPDPRHWLLLPVLGQRSVRFYNRK